MADATTRVAIAGAGSIGCYMGGQLALAGRNVALLARPRIAEAVTRHGLAVRDLDGPVRRLEPGRLTISSRAKEALAGAGIVLVTVKTRDTEDMAGIIAQYAPRDAIVVSLQNGVRNAETLRAALGAGARVRAGMVPFNVVQGVDNSGDESGEDGAPLFHRATSGTVRIEAGEGGEGGLGAVLDVPGCAVREAADMQAILWGKLVLNLNNALNALSGLPLAAQLADRRWRLLLADQVAEALAVMRAAGIEPAAVEGVPPRLIPTILRLPDWLFRLVARRMLAIDPAARLSMYDDLTRGRTPEIDVFQGEIAALAKRTGTPVPLTRAVVKLVNAAHAAGAGSPRLEPGAIARAM